jgi:uncharacterized 2Fe-2S/4Fe-4S cluster protein (DUF4445 family)
LKIRTKRLFALGVIPLFPPAAAYVAPIGNPRIASALRLDVYEAEQGETSQKLLSDLHRIASAVEESLRESYRTQVEPKQREDAKRQRRLANAAFSSGITAYETDLGTMTRSQKGTGSAV